MIACGMHPDCTMNFNLQYWMSSRDSSVGTYVGADMVHVLTRGACQVVWCMLGHKITWGRDEYGHV